VSWHPNDLVSDADLLAYEQTILTQFNRADWNQKRAKALEDWMWPQVRERGFAADRFRTRFAADKVLGNTSSVFTDLTDAAASTTADDINLATTLAGSSDYLAIGSIRAFRGVSIRTLDAVNTAAAVLTVEVWEDGWVPLAVTDGTQATDGKPFSKGGSLTWSVPSEWVLRPLNSSDPLYYARIKLSATPTSAKCGQITCIRRSVLCAPATFRTLALIFREAPVSHKSPWLEKADFYEKEAEMAMSRALPLVSGEFDLGDPPDDIVDEDEAQQTQEQAGGTFRWERA
jgi:hypothetical protein